MSDHHVRPSPRARLLALLAVVLAVMPAAPAAAQADPAAVEAAAGTWLAGQHDAGAVTSVGALADLVLALAGTDEQPAALADAATDLEGALAEYLGAGGEEEGTLAKGLLGLRVAGRGAGGAVADAEARLRGLVQADGDDAGRVADASNFTQALAVMALSTTDGGAPPSTRAYLAGQRCPDGGIEFDPSPAAEGDPVTGALGLAQAGPRCTSEGGGHVDTTAVVVQALLGSVEGEDAEVAAARDGAAAWLADQQAVDGGFDSNANSTGLAGQALRAAGDEAAADAAAAFVARLQIPEGEADAGAIRFRADDDGSLFLATTQGVLALGAPALQQVGGPGQAPGPAAGPIPVGEACDDGEGVTVVVDLTAFDAGVRQGCAAGDPTSGLEALRAAGFDVITQTSDFGEFVCAIDGLPELACEQPFEGSFWAYSSGADDGTWTAQQVGADAADPAPGDVEGWRYGEGEGPSVPSTGSPVRRLAGGSRIDTAVEVSRATYPGGGATAAVLARADDFADALAGVPLAVAVGGPLLVTGTDDLAPAVAAELQRILPAGATVHVLGGPAAISEDVVAALGELGYAVDRIQGGDRVTTSIAVARALGDPATLLLTTGQGFADAVAAGAAAAATGDGAVLLTPGDRPHPALDEYLDAQPAAEVVAVGGPAATAYPEATPIVGATREATAVAVAEAFVPNAPVVGIARRDDFADALAGGPHIARLGGPLLLTDGAALSEEVAAHLCRTAGADEAVLYGGAAAVTDEVGGQVAEALAAEDCS
jgi:hypothetical protein